MQNNLLKGVFWLLFFMTIYGCKKDNSKTEPEEPTNYLSKQDVKPYNPYALDNMRKAYANLLMKDVQLMANDKAKYAHGKIMFSNSNSALAIQL